MAVRPDQPIIIINCFFLGNIIVSFWRVMCNILCLFDWLISSVGVR